MVCFFWVSAEPGYDENLGYKTVDGNKLILLAGGIAV